METEQEPGRWSIPHAAEASQGFLRGQAGAWHRRGWVLGRTREARQCRALGLRGSHMNRGDQRPRDTRCGGTPSGCVGLLVPQKLVRASGKVKTASHGDRAQPFSSYQRTAARCCLEDIHQETSEVTVRMIVGRDRVNFGDEWWKRKGIDVSLHHRANPAPGQ